MYISMRLLGRLVGFFFFTNIGTQFQGTFKDCLLCRVFSRTLERLWNRMS